MSFANTLKELLKENALSQSQLAAFIGFSQRAVSKWINAQAEPTETAITACADFFKVSVDYLLGREDDYGSTAIPINKNPVESLSPTEKKILRQYRNLCTGYQNLIEEQIQFLTDQEEALKIPNSVIPNTPNNRNDKIG